MPRAVYGVKWRRGDEAPDRQRPAPSLLQTALDRCSRDAATAVSRPPGPFWQAQGSDAACADILPCPFLR